MFDKNKFAQILKNINETYNSQRDFSKKSEINRTYLSQYMNMKLDDPPKPKILNKLAKASNGLVTYEDLMVICGYTSKNIEDIFNYIFDKYKKEFYKLNLDDEQINYLYKLFNPLYLTDKDISVEIAKFVDTLPPEKIPEIYCIIDSFCSEHKELLSEYNNILAKEFKKRKDIKIRNVNCFKQNNNLFNIPVLGKIAAGQPLLAEEHLEGYLPVDPNIYGMTTSDDYFYLKVSGESMNLKVHNGDYALIHKQNYAENGDIIVAIVNGDDEATMKRYKKINEQFVLLEPMSTDPTIEAISVDLKNTKFQIIGKAIGQFGKF